MNIFITIVLVVVVLFVVIWKVTDYKKGLP